MEIVIPNLGDIDEVEVIELCVAVGDTVAVDDAVVVIESDKASMEVPSTAAGVVEAIHVAVGDQVGEGHVIAQLKADAADTVVEEAPVSETPSEPPPADDQPVETPAPAASEAGPVDVLVPDIGDASGVVVIEVAVQPGDTVSEHDLLVVLESDKASMEITAEQSGTVVSVEVAVDQEVEQGTRIAVLQVEQATAVAAADPAPTESAAPREPAAPKSPPDAAPASKPAAAPAATAPKTSTSETVYAGPAVRRLAREMGVDLTQVAGTGNRGRITKDDVKAFVKQQLQAPSSGGGLPAVNSVDHSKFGEIELVEMSRIRRAGADNLHRSWVNLPHVTQHNEADVTDLESFRQSLKPEAEQKGVRVTPLAFIVKACCSALQTYPVFNSSLHDDRQHLVMKSYINIGMAVDTPDGLVVPVIKAADQKSIWQLSAEIAELSEKARNKKLALDDLQGGTFSISSLGALGGTGFTPIVNAPEVAILGVSNLATKPMWNGNEFVPRKMLPLSLSYDHRVINGADAGRFVVYLTQVLGDIRRLAL